jgi:hypothetical protein
MQALKRVYPSSGEPVVRWPRRRRPYDSADQFSKPHHLGDESLRALESTWRPLTGASSGF